MAHIHKLIDFVANVFIVHKNKVLLIHHKELAMWLPIGGHIELNENPDQAAMREVKEESGLKVRIISEKLPNIGSRKLKVLNTPEFLNIHKIKGKHKHVALTYFAEALSDKVKLNKKEHEEIRWFSKRDLDISKYKIGKDIKFCAHKAIAKINKK